MQNLEETHGRLYDHLHFIAKKNDRFPVTTFRGSFADLCGVSTHHMNILSLRCSCLTICHIPCLYYIYIHSYVYMYVCSDVYVCMCICIYVYVYIYMYICIYVYLYMYICIYVYMYICIYVYICIHMYTYVYICIHMYMYVYVYIYTIYKCTWTYIYIYTAYKCVCVSTISFYVYINLYLLSYITKISWLKPTWHAFVGCFVVGRLSRFDGFSPFARLPYFHSF